MSTDRHMPPPARQLVYALIDAGWQLRVTWSTQGGYLHVTIDGTDPDPQQDIPRAVHATWHTRPHGTLRLFSCLIGPTRACHDATLKQAMTYVSETS